VTAGVVDALDRLPVDAARDVLDTALGYGHKSVRRAAYDYLLARDEHDRVWRLCRTDPDSSIRAWAERERQTASQPQLLVHEQDTLFPID
jgi:hypothetical protein